MARHPRTHPGVRGTQLGVAYSKVGAKRFDFADPYHFYLTIHWPAFVIAVFGLYGVINTLFALLYVAQPGCVANVRPGHLADAFFFSI